MSGVAAVLRSRGVVAVLLLAAAAAVVASGSAELWGAATLLVAAFAAGEWAALSGITALRARFAYAAFFVLLSLAGEFYLFAGDLSHRPLWAAVAIFWGFVAPWWLLKRASGRGVSGGRDVFGVLCGALGMLLLYAAWQAAKILYERDMYMLLVGLAAVWLFDSFAYFVGRVFGRTRMSEISPNKTMEGLLGGLTVVAAAALLFKVQIGGREYSAVLSLSAVVALAALATIGDLFESNLKRKAGVKDSGALLGAHGGVLDRMDAVLPVLPFVALLSPWT